jgi:hypothetical protein
MISSTYYDLKQIRKDLRQFIEEELGYTAFISEDSSFPIDHDVDAIANCRRRVEEDADILVVVVGHRYGYVESASGKSVTNLEYLTARPKGITIYAFIEKSAMALYNLWREKPGTDFGKQVDDSALFEFIDQLRAQIWTHEFESAQEIISVLRQQLAHKMHRLLSLDLKLKPLNEEFDGLAGPALRIALERQTAWEYRLFVQLLRDELWKYRDAKRDHAIGIALNSGENVPPQTYHEWLVARLTEGMQILEGMAILINQSLQEAFGPPGVSGDIAYIRFVAARVAMGYSRVLDWAQRIRAAQVDDCFLTVNWSVSKSLDDFLGQIEEFGPMFLRALEEQLALPEAERSERILMLSPQGMNTELLQRQLVEATECYKRKVGGTNRTEFP